MKWLACPVVAVSLALASAAVAIAADAPATYRWVDAQGVVHYSDTPQPGAQQIQIPPVQTYRAPPRSNDAASRNVAAPPPPAPIYQECAVVQPTREQSFYAPEEVPVSVELEPTLRPQDQVAVTVDGEALESTAGSKLHFRIATPERGEHTVAVTVHDTDGNVLCSSGATFYVERPSLLSPRAPARGH